MLVRLRDSDALLLVDVQNDFLPGGALGVPEGNRVVGPLNRALALFRSRSLPILATRDWHPADHCSFEAQGGPWPPHCIADSAGAGFAPGLDLPPSAPVVSKATARDKDAYSGFEGTDLDERLEILGVKQLFVGGLATDYCVLNTVRDALDLGYQVRLLTDAVRAVEVKPGDGERALQQMYRKGALPVLSSELAA